MLPTAHDLKVGDTHNAHSLQTFKVQIQDGGHLRIQQVNTTTSLFAPGQEMVSNIKLTEEIALVWAD